MIRQFVPFTASFGSALEIDHMFMVQLIGRQFVFDTIGLGQHCNVELWSGKGLMRRN